MNSVEFSEWLDYHTAAFTGIPEWLSKRPAAAGTMARWQTVLQHVTLSDAKLATDLLFAQEEQPRGYDRHPAAIAAIARKNSAPKPFEARKFVDGEEVFNCPVCLDGGVLVCWHPEAMRAVKQTGSLEGCGSHTVAKACNCPAGDQYANAMGRYSPKKWIIHPICVESEAVAQLAEILASAKDTRRERAFDAFSH